MRAQRILLGSDFIAAPATNGKRNGKGVGAPGPNGAQTSSKAQPAATASKGNTPIPSSPKQNGHYAMGDILLLEGGGVIVFRQPVPDKNYDFTYQLVADGRFEARAIAMRNQAPRKLGRVDSEYLRRLIREKKWDRQEMTAALLEPEFAQWLPSEDGRVELDGAAAGPGKISLSRGTRIVIKNGQHAWQAVYWGAGGNGEDILAHKAGRSWHLTNMSLKNYGDKLEVGEPAPDHEIDEIMECVLAAE